MNIKKAIGKVFSSNLISIISGIIVGFFVPAILSIEGYAYLKTYKLYFSFINLAQFGFLEGIYIKYGGKNYNTINKSVLKSEHVFLVKIGTLIFVLVLFASLLFRHIPLLILSFSILPYIIVNYHKMIYLATGEFSKYSKIVYISTTSYLLLNVFLTFVIKTDNYVYYALTTVLSDVLSIFIVELSFIKSNKNVKTHINNKEMFKLMKVGIVILIGNLAVSFLLSIDKWFVKLFLSVDEFAYYSFAVSMFGIINSLVNSISLTFYNYLFKNTSEKSINKLKDILIVIGAFSSIAYFGFDFLIIEFLPKYINSLKIISITFSTFPYLILINALYLNLYKVNKNEKKYLKVVLSMLVISIIYNIIAIMIWNNTSSLAYATIITLVTWVVYSSKDLNKIHLSSNMICYMGLLTISFIYISNTFNWLTGFILYLADLLLLTMIFYKNVINDIKKITYEIIKNAKKKY